MKPSSKQITRRSLPDDPKVLQDAIVMMESRLKRLGDGDCAYEKAMIRFYEQQLLLHRARLQLQPMMREMPSLNTRQGLSGRV